MRRSIFFLSAGLTVSALASSGCADEPFVDEVGDGEEPSASVSAALSATDPVSAAVDNNCSTSVVKALSAQLIDEIQCLRPNTMKRIDDVPGLALRDGVFPYLQTPAADALSRAQKARGVTLTINSGLRTLPQQYLLYRWYLAKRCDITLAAKPGTSNHESAVAVDISDNAAWRTAMAGQSFKWLGAGDPVHFDFQGGGTVDLKGLSVKAFQRLWNRNHPEDVIEEDGDYGTATETRLARAPIGGFATGAVGCAAAPATPAPPPAAEPPAPAPDDKPKDDLGARGSRGGEEDGAGCSAGGSTSKGGGLLVPLLVAGALAARRRRVRTA